jgi:uncharacterized protein (TIGR03000 family)
MKKASQLQCWTLGGLTLALVALAGWAQQPDQEGPVKLTVKVPNPNAILTVDGNPTKQTGIERKFESPPVSTTKKYTYVIKITWQEGGKERTATKKVRVSGGKDYNVDFTKEESGTKKDTTKKDVTKKDTAKRDVTKKDVTKKDTAKKDVPAKDTRKDVPAKDTRKDVPAKDTDTKDTGTKDTTKKDTDNTKDKADKKSNPDTDKGAAAPRTREFLFTYAATVTRLTPGQTARVWVPLPPRRLALTSVTRM